MTVSSINPFALGNIGRSEGASTYRAVEPVKFTQTEPKSEGFKGFATTEDIEKASQYLEGNVNLSSRVNRGASTNPIDARGAAWEGFSVPESNGTGELIPQYEEGERICDYIA